MVKLIVVVDDVELMRNSITIILEIHGCAVIKAANGQQALQCLKEHWTTHQRLPDLILAELNMPVMDGFELYLALKVHPLYQNIPFVALTGDAFNTSNPYPGFEFDRVIFKPFKIVDLLALLNQI